VDIWKDWFGMLLLYWIVKNDGVGMVIPGSQEWTDYQVKAKVTTFLALSIGLEAHIKGLRSFYVLQLCRDGKAGLIKTMDETTTMLKETDFDFQVNQDYELTLKVEANKLKEWVDVELRLEAEDHENHLYDGVAFLLVEEGMLFCEAVGIG
jgi:hypothetical protein